MTRCLLGLGSNLGDPVAQMNAAVQSLRDLPVSELLDCSPYIRTAAVGGPAGQQSFLNAAAVINTALTAAELLEHLQRIEAQLGRVRRTRWAARTLDLDLLLFGTHQLAGPTLQVPHPWMCLRRFVLEPAVHVAAEMVHPGMGWTVGQLWRHLDDAPRYVAVTGPTATVVTATVQDVVQALGRRAGGEAMAVWDRSGPERRDPIELLLRRADMLQGMAVDARESSRGSSRPTIRNGADSDGAIPSDTTSSARWWLSDFWIEQGAASAAVRDAGIRRRWMSCWHALQSEGYGDANRHVIQPRLVVVLCPEWETAADGDERLVTADLICRATRPGRGPYLILRPQTPQQARHDLLAAVLAMDQTP